MRRAKLFVDGASKGNPGPAGYGFVLEINNKKIEGWGSIGIATNNIAEYRALIEGLKKAKELGVEEIEIFSDSLLIVKQIKGEYRVKTPHLKPLLAEVQKLLRKFKKSNIFHIGREKNRLADALASRGAEAVPQEAGRSLPGSSPAEESPGPTGQGAG